MIKIGFDPDMMEGIGNPNISDEQIRVIYEIACQLYEEDIKIDESRAYSYFISMADNPGIPLDLLIEMSESDYEDVRRHVAMNPKTPAYVIADMVKAEEDSDPDNDDLLELLRVCHEQRLAQETALAERNRRIDRAQLLLPLCSTWSGPAT